jgi:hypothetical protein
MDEHAIRRHVVRRLYTKKAFVHGHLLSERLLHGVPSHLRGTAKRVLAQLVREEVVLRYGPTEHGAAYQLNIERLEEIERMLQE